MSDCCKDQTKHAVVITETNQVDSWEAYPSVICVGSGDMVAFYIKSHLVSNKTVTIYPNVGGFFSSADLTTHRNNVLVTKVIVTGPSASDISVKSGLKPKGDDLFAPILTVKVRR